MSKSKQKPVEPVEAPKAPEVPVDALAQIEAASKAVVLEAPKAPEVDPALVDALVAIVKSRLPYVTHGGVDGILATVDSFEPSVVDAVKAKIGV
jgi:hypothetical protein